jgi:hypothetical protein
MAKKELRLSDQVIGQLRELLQLSMLTGTNFVDHCRALRLEESEKTEGTLILSESYTQGWNDMAKKLHQEAQEKAEQMAAGLAQDNEEGPVKSEDEVVISRDPQTGKLIGTRQKAQN